jgi:selenium-binding protein 1
MDFGKMLGDAEAMKRFGNTVVVWNLHSRKPKKIFDVPGAPLEIRCAWGASHDYCFTSTALTSKIWLIYADAQGEWQAAEVADIGDPAEFRCRSTSPFPPTTRACGSIPGTTA